METTELMQSALNKYQELWDQMEDINADMKELRESILEMLEDLQSELMDIQLEAGGWFKLIESLQKNHSTPN